MRSAHLTHGTAGGQRRAHLTSAEAQVDLGNGTGDTQTEAAGLVQLVVVQSIDAAGIRADAIAGNSEAVWLSSLISQASDGIAGATKWNPKLCASCPRPLRRRSCYAFVVAMLLVDRPEQAIVMAVCTRCATEPDAIMAKAVSALRSIWPDLRLITIHEAAGHA